MTGFGVAPFGTSPFGGSGTAVDPTIAGPAETWAPRAADWQIHPRNRDLTRTFDPVSGWRSLVLVERHNTPDTWTVTGLPSSLAVFTPGMGAVLDRDDQQITSGQVTSIRRAATTVAGRLSETVTVAFASDLAALGGRLVRPTPAHVVGPAITTFPTVYDLRAGAVEDLVLGYIGAHIGGSALTDRRLLRFRLPASLARGGSTQVSGRLDNLGVLIQTLAEAGNLRVRIVHDEDVGGAWLNLSIEPIADLSDNIRFGTADSAAAGLITDYTYEIAAPTTTRPLVGLGGEDAAREFLELRDTTAEALWGRVVETFVDQRQIAPDSADKLAEATRAAQEALDAGKGPVSVSFTPALGPDIQYRRDVRVGDIVGYDLPGLDPAEDKVREATTVVSVENGQPTERVTIVVGTPDAASSRDQQQTAKALRAINVIQRST